MARIRQKITTYLWFDDQVEEAASFHASLFDDSRIVSTIPCGAAKICKLCLVPSLDLIVVSTGNAFFIESPPAPDRVFQLVTRDASPWRALSPSARSGSSRNSPSGGMTSVVYSS